MPVLSNLNNISHILSKKSSYLQHVILNTHEISLIGLNEKCTEM